MAGATSPGGGASQAGVSAGGTANATAGASNAAGGAAGGGGDGGETTALAGATSVACTPTRPRREVCDGIDNDCTGEADEGNTCPASCRGIARDGVGYMLCDEQLPWPLAAAACVTQGMHLLRVDSEAENDFVGNASFGGTLATAVWLSGNDVPLLLSDAGLAGDGTWEWDDGTPFWVDGASVVGVYENWADGEPPPGTAGGCAEMRGDANAAYEWFRQPCVSLRRFACERP